MQCTSLPPRWRPQFLVSLLLIIALNAGFAQEVAPQTNSAAAGVIVYLTHPGGLNEFAEALYFRDVNMEPLWAAINVGAAKPVIVPRDCVVSTVYFEQALTMNLVGSNDRATVVNTRDELAAMAKQFPKSESLARPIIISLDSSIKRMDDGEIRRDGAWVKPVNPVAERKAEIATLEKRLAVLAHLKTLTLTPPILGETMTQTKRRLGEPQEERAGGLSYRNSFYWFLVFFIEGKSALIDVSHPDHSPLEKVEFDGIMDLFGRDWQPIENSGTRRRWSLPDGTVASYGGDDNTVIVYTQEWQQHIAQQNAKNGKPNPVAPTPDAPPQGPRETSRHEVILEARTIAEKESPHNYELQLSRIEGIVNGWRYIDTIKHAKLSDESRKTLNTMISDAEKTWGWDYNEIGVRIKKEINTFDDDDRPK